MKAMVRVLVMAVVLSSRVLAQSFNIDVGGAGSGPASTYAAAGWPGIWNVVQAEHTTPFTTGPHPNDYMLVDINGNPTGVGLHQYGGMDQLTANDPSVSGNDAALLNDAMVTHSLTLETCTYLNGLQNGTYEVLVYAWMPNQPSSMAQTRFDFHPGVELVGGAWPGAHVEGVTYSRHIVQVTSGNMGLHVGIPSGGNTAIGAAWNGLQLRPLQGIPVPVSPKSVLLMTAIVVSAGAFVFRKPRRKLG